MSRLTIFQLIALCGTLMNVMTAANLQYLGQRPERGSSEAVIVEDVALVHTAQVMGVDRQGSLVGKDSIQMETDQCLANIKTALESANSGLDRLIKLNVYIAATELRAPVESALAKAFPSDRKPAVSFVVTRLPIAEARVAMDAVSVHGDATNKVRLTATDQLTSVKRAHVSVIPPGSRIYVAGQAEKGANLAEATRRTLESLSRTLEFLGRKNDDIIQLKSFLSPMTDVRVVEDEISAFFGTNRAPPAIFVEWTAPLIEIELIAWGGTGENAPAIEFITPPGMSASPVFSRVTKINRSPSIYVSGLFAPGAIDAADETQQIFGQLEKILSSARSDLKHLAKATYYCSTGAASQKLNELRPNYYDPKRPPSASKAMVADVGHHNAGLTIDMIAVPAAK